MGDVATNSASFAKEFDKAFERLLACPAGPSVSHDARQAHYCAELRVAEILGHFVPKLPDAVCVPKLLQIGAILTENHDADLANKRCFEHILGLQLLRPTAQDSKPPYPQLERASHHISALLGQAACRRHILLRADPSMCHPDTVAGLIACLQVR